MRSRKRNALKLIGLTVGLLGLSAGLANLLGAFSNSEREYMVALIKSKGEVPANVTGFAEVLEAFPPPTGWSTTDIRALSPLSAIRSGGHNTIIGPLVYVGYGRRTGPIVTFEDFANWSSSSKYPWLAWAISFVGWLVVFVGVVADIRAGFV